MKKSISKNTIKASLSIACCNLLHTSTEVHAALLDDISIDSAVMVYSESEGRVSLIEPIIRLKTELEEDQFLTIQLVFDALTGASPNGAQASNIPQTFTAPSGESEYTTSPNTLPLDSSFHDTRFSLSTNLEQPIDRLNRNTFSLALSTELDWNSFSAGYSYSHDLNQKNTTLTAGLSTTLDNISPPGGAPVDFEPMVAPNVTQPKDGAKDRNTMDFITGITQIINKKTLTQFNYSFSQSNGYHNDAYKIISVIDNTTGQPNGTYLYESRPDNRQRHAIYWKTVHHFSEDVINVAYRNYQDDWGIKSHTIDVKYRYELANNSFVQPHIRFYTQSSADFFRHSLLASELTSLPDYASADLRLDQFDSITIGLKYSQKLSMNENWSTRLEFLQQTGNSYPDNAIVEQRLHNLYPDLNAVIVQFSYSFIW